MIINGSSKISAPDIGGKLDDIKNFLGKQIGKIVKRSGTRDNRVSPRRYYPKSELTKRDGDSSTNSDSDGDKDVQEIELCHTSCMLLNQGKLKDTLLTIKSFMESNPYEIITILFENYDKFDSKDVESAFKNTGIDKYVFNPLNYFTPPTDVPITEPIVWPSLAQMITDNNRLVVFTSQNANPQEIPWLMLQGDYVSETSFSVREGSQFQCDLKPSPIKYNQNGEITNIRTLFTINHFVFKDITVAGEKFEAPSEEGSKRANTFESLASHIKACSKAESSKDLFPNFIAVDYYDSGDLMNAVAAINKVPLITSSKTSNDGSSQRLANGPNGKNTNFKEKASNSSYSSKIPGIFNGGVGTLLSLFLQF
ncbi:hypothetical protein AX774_g6671 [Zancudomyces culisetae]|uniref:PI-PLC X domain-containing protein n=1 Tax=Zancudomyces culisetae TaxID=1213189 RepID=A0A1R1PG11_ZANCU|nr:hypothetical protein AX774_g6671 [Zancudomyces culisetae]|eukprot:OMH79906.1 hypothetical protein AX774_g6671 [Zancudomyces culisetae]